ncbi:2TM domain-containing protein [Flavobacterium sp.]|uniref:2TM domain-containing protein n=1 Tax=Flavobacterium sp. TaxID=239 RepID=UPI002FDA2057
METNTEFERYQKASKKVKEIKGFYIHFICYVIVISLMVYLNLKFSPEHLWFFYPMLGWGVGLIGHAIGVFGTDSLFSKNWEERKIKELMEKEKKNKYL